MNKAIFVLGMVTGLCCLSVTSLRAAPILPPATFKLVVNDSGSFLTSNNPGKLSGSTFTLGGNQGSDASGSYSVGAGSVSADGSNQGSAPPDAGAVGVVTFSVDVIGLPGVNVPLDITATGSTFASGSAFAQAIVENVSTGTNLFFACSGIVSPKGCAFTGIPSSFSGTKTKFVMSDTPFSLKLVAVGSTFDNQPGIFFASVDPMITIDPSFAQANQFSLVFSPNSSGGGAVPEPGSLELLGTGLLSLAGLFWRKTVARPL